jgi:hypothetical protein
MTIECTHCIGTGCKHVHDYMIDEPCDNCSGTGMNPEFEEALNWQPEEDSWVS